ncbi:MAG TPA: hypothetical protein VIV06_04230 [Candidatus Limnocylindrales bacterium]
MTVRRGGPRARITPELVAFALVVALAIPVGAVVAVSTLGATPAPSPGQGSPAASPGASTATAGSPTATGSAAGQSPSAVPTPSAPAPTPTAVAPTPSPPTPSPGFDSARLAPLLTLASRLTDSRAELVARLANPPIDPGAIAIILREVGATATSGVQVADRLLVAGAPPLAGTLRVQFQTVRDAATETLRATLSDAAAYDAGARAVIIRIDELAAAAGLLPSPSPVVPPQSP